MSHFVHSVHGRHQLQAQTTNLDKLLPLLYHRQHIKQIIVFFFFHILMNLLAWLRMSRIYSVMGPLLVGLYSLSKDCAQQKGPFGISFAVATMGWTF